MENWEIALSAGIPAVCALIGALAAAWTKMKGKKIEEKLAIISETAKSNIKYIKTIVTGIKSLATKKKK